MVVFDTRTRTLCAFLLVMAGLLDGCSVVRDVTRESPNDGATTTVPPRPEAGRYDAVLGLDRDGLAELRAAPAPASPVVSEGKNQANDEQVLSNQGFLRVGTGHYPAATPAMREVAVRQGERVGAERMLVYVSPAAGTSDDALVAVYYVHFKAPFGASFRDLTAAERQALGVSGGISIGAIIGGTPAASANLLAGDAVTNLDGKPVANKAAFQDMLRASAGKRVVLTINRDGVTVTRVVRVGLLPPAKASH